MSAGFHVVVCGGLVPDPLQSLEPVTGPDGPGLRNEAMLPSVLDPWAAHSLYEAAHLAGAVPDTRVWLVSLAPKARLQQLMMTTAQKVPFELVAIDGPSTGFVDAYETAAALAGAIERIPELDRSRLLLFGGCSSASRDAGVTLSLVGELLGIRDQFLAVDALAIDGADGLNIHERVEGGRYLVSRCAGPPAVLGWATGSLPEPPNNPKVGMLNMRAILPALQKAATASLARDAVTYVRVEVPAQRRETRIVKDASADEIARELVDWIGG
jgi:electron transfer flavoprotein beta subunit